MQEHDVERFIEPVNQHLDAALREISAGEKETHWMWFMFPQLQSLGGSAMAQRFGIVDLDHARPQVGQLPGTKRGSDGMLERYHRDATQGSGHVQSLERAGQAQDMLRNVRINQVG